MGAPSLANIPTLTAIRCELFRRKEFDFITVAPHPLTGKEVNHLKQAEALRILTDNHTEEFAYGGAAGGAKSWTGAEWCTWQCLCYPGVHAGVGRLELKSLRESTYLTFLKVFAKYELKEGTDYKYNGQDHYFTFSNGSRISFIEMKYQPRDPYYERFGSKEYTFIWIEEAGEVPAGAFDTLKTRAGRHLNDKYGLVGKVFITLNPKKNWVHSYFWKRYKDGTLPDGIKFLQALVQDNPLIDSGYIKKLHAITDPVKKQRLLYGNFDYDDDENMLMVYDAIEALFTNWHLERGPSKYITADVARFGKDTTTIYVWAGWLVIERHVMNKSSVTQVAVKIREIANKHSIVMRFVVVDDDGVGGGVVDILRCKGFVNNSSPMDNPKTKEPQNYENLATQCSYMAAVCVNDGLIGFAEGIGDTEVNGHTFKEHFIEEAEQIKKRDADNDGKLKVIRKEDIKEFIGRSPDDWDAFKMRQFFELAPVRKLAMARY